MYSIKQGLIIGFHGCDKSTFDLIIGQSDPDLKTSNNSYDWLGNGIYFWENNYERALKWAKLESKKPNSKIKTPAVIGAVISLGNCLDLLDSKNISLLKNGYELLKIYTNVTNTTLPENKNPIGVESEDYLLRNLDCAVIETVCTENAPNLFDSVRGMFIEGKRIYDKSGFYEKSHIQISIRNPNCIKGYFIPKTINTQFSKV